MICIDNTRCVDLLRLTHEEFADFQPGLMVRIDNGNEPTQGWRHLFREENRAWNLMYPEEFFSPLFIVISYRIAHGDFVYVYGIFEDQLRWLSIQTV